MVGVNSRRPAVPLVAMIGVVGLGAMGSRIAARLLECGHPVMVWNRTAGKAAPLVACGAELAATPADVGASCQVVITMLADPLPCTPRFKVRPGSWPGSRRAPR
jgi:glutamyl-tRNA reductase